MLQTGSYKTPYPNYENAFGKCAYCHSSARHRTDIAQDMSRSIAQVRFLIEGAVHNLPPPPSTAYTLYMRHRLRIPCSSTSHLILFRMDFELSRGNNKDFDRHKLNYKPHQVTRDESSSLLQQDIETLTFPPPAPRLVVGLHLTHPVTPPTAARTQNPEKKKPKQGQMTNRAQHRKSFTILLSLLSSGH